MSDNLRAGAVSRTEDASGAAAGCPQSVESAILRAFENASRTTGACFAHRISLPYRRSLFFTPNASENASRTRGGYFAHGTHIPYHRWPSPVPNTRQRQVATAAEPDIQKSGRFCRPLCGLVFFKLFLEEHRSHFIEAATPCEELVCRVLRNVRHGIVSCSL